MGLCSINIMESKIKLTIVMFAFAFLILSSLVSASIGEMQTIKYNSCISLSQICSNCTYNNITSIRFPNGTENAYSPEIAMSKTGITYLYNFCDTSQFGVYIINGKADLDGQLTLWNYELDDTADGNPYQAFPYQIIIILFGVALIIVGIYARSHLVIYCAATILVVIGILTLYPGYSYINYSNLLGLSLGIISIAIGFFFFFYDFINEEVDE